MNFCIWSSDTASTLLLPQQFFQLEVYNSDGSRLTESQIHSQLQRIRSQSWKTDKEPVGILTSEHRHTWGQAYNRLLTGTSRGAGASARIQHSALNCEACTVWHLRPARHCCLDNTNEIMTVYALVSNTSHTSGECFCSIHLGSTIMFIWLN